ncbi:MAG: class I SAM-dependent methyltransferase [Myxococcales bacterium]
MPPRGNRDRPERAREHRRPPRGGADLPHPARAARRGREERDSGPGRPARARAGAAPGRRLAVLEAAAGERPCGARPRSRSLDRRVEEFVAEGGETAVVSVGCGLDTRRTRLRSRPATWIDLDLPEVIALRRAIVSEADPAVVTIAGSFLEPAWLEVARPRLAGARILLVAEGVLNYLPAPELAAALKRTGEVLGACTLMADVMSRFFGGLARFMGAIRTTGAGIRWGASSAAQCERLLDVRTRSLEAYLRPDDPALGRSRGMYRVPLFREMSQLLVAELGEEARTAHLPERGSCPPRN